MKTYCRDCGSPVEHKGIKPNFCPNCGEKMSSFGSPRSPKKPTAVSTMEDSSEDEDTERRPIDISKLDVEISVSSSKLTVGDLAGSAGQGFSLDRGTPEEEKGGKEQFMEEFRKEAGGDPHRPR